jgi:hypothetical protein
MVEIYNFSWNDDWAYLNQSYFKHLYSAYIMIW